VATTCLPKARSILSKLETLYLSVSFRHNEKMFGTAQVDIPKRL
jgi:hypothetical protein